MADSRLVFSRPVDSDAARLVFGDDGAALVPAAEIGVDAQWPGDDMACSVQLLWESGVSRGEAVQLRSAWQGAVGVAEPVGLRWEPAAHVAQRCAGVFSLAQQVSELAASRWQQSDRLRVRSGLVWELGLLQRGAFAVDWQQALGRRGNSLVLWGAGSAERSVAQTMYSDAQPLRTVAASGWSRGSHKSGFVWVLGRSADAVRRLASSQWERADRPAAGVSAVVPPVEPPVPPCFDEAERARVVFEQLADGRGKLIFLCVRGGEKALVVVQSRRLYVSHNSVTLTRLPSGSDFMASSFTLDVDADSWTFGWSAALHASARQHLVRSVPGERVEVLAMVNGQALRLVVDSIGRDRQFPTDRIRVRGRGLAAALDAVSLSFGNASARTAQQLMADVLTVNGVSMGWAVDWQIQDWLVPGGVWLHQGSYISALQDIAGAAGGYLQPHFTDRVIRVLPRYPDAPWRWAELTPDLELPVAVTSMEASEEVVKPAYNRVFVGGVAAGVFGPVTRDGTAGDVVAPQVSHALITAPAAHRQSGLAVLSDTGFQEHLSLKTLLLPEMGIVMPGKLVRYVSDDGPRLGLVRRTSVNMSNWPVMHQTIGVETHVE